MRDTINNALKRCMASIVHGDFDGVIAECDAAEKQAAEKQVDYHWLFDFSRGFALYEKGCVQEAEDAWCRADANYDPRFPLYPSQLAAFYVSCNTADREDYLNGEDYLNALRYINRFLSVGNNEDILGLYVRGRLKKSLAEGMDDETMKMALFNDATEDLQQAYKLLRHVPDEKFYVFKSLRDIVATRYDEAVTLYEDIVGISLILNFLSQFPTIVNATDAPVLEARNLFGAVMPADPIRIEIGLALLSTLAETDGPLDLDEVLVFLKDLSSVTCRNGQVIWHTFTLLLIVRLHIDMHDAQADSNDNNYLEEAETVFADFLRLANQHQIYDTLAEQIEDTETQLNRLRREET